ncbi:LOW QUALITY PROTEIN: hypothetical protein HID58_038014 [Brassica napus]|uniref:Uncharacterized protein n=1 Tax=Brassica napus TaxID=3708 RepID=A0ABQ8BNT5_BRANA|nr:LOW QUALITY PROTEIN: hypothetical protein HID58_038014 [Brassica napus]
MQFQTLLGEIPKAPFPMIQGGSVYLMDKWIEDPSDKEDEMKKTCEGESSKSVAMGTPKLKLAVEELEMDHLILQIQNGRMLDDLSQTETEKLKSYASKKFQTLLGEIPKAPFPMIQGGSVYLMDKWIEDPSDKEDEMKKTCEGESSKSVAMGTPKLKLAVEELEMDHLILQIQNGRMLDDLSQTETEKLKSYASKKFQTLLGEIPKAPFPMIQGGSVYLMDKWIEDPSDKEDEMKKTCEGESSKSVAMGTPKLKLAVEELEMDHLILQIQNGRMLDDLSQTETEKLKSYASKKFQTLLGEIPKAPFPMIHGGSVYLMDKWIEDPSDKEDEMKKTCEGESSKSVGKSRRQRRIHLSSGGGISKKRSYGGGKKTERSFTGGSTKKRSSGGGLNQREEEPVGGDAPLVLDGDSVESWRT